MAARPCSAVREVLGALLAVAGVDAGAGADPVAGGRTDSDRAVRWVPHDQWHVTLRFWADHDIDPVMSALDRAAADGVLGCAMARFGPSVERLGPTALVVPVRGLDQLASEVGVATGGAPDRVYRGHLTLGRFRGRPRRDASHRLVGAEVAAECAVTEIELVESELGTAGASHRIVGSWPLRA